MTELKEILLRIVEWSKLKCRLQSIDTDELYFKEREIWWAHMGANVGSEQNGKNDGFDRPILILKKFTANMFWGIPITTQQKDGSYYYPTSHNEDQKQQIIVLHQMRAMSSKRLIKKQRRLPVDEFEEVRNQIKNLI